MPPDHPRHPPMKGPEALLSNQSTAKSQAGAARLVPFGKACYAPGTAPTYSLTPQAWHFMTPVFQWDIEIGEVRQFVQMTRGVRSSSGGRQRAGSGAGPGDAGEPGALGDGWERAGQGEAERARAGGDISQGSASTDEKHEKVVWWGAERHWEIKAVCFGNAELIARYQEETGGDTCLEFWDGMQESELQWAGDRAPGGAWGRGQRTREGPNMAGSVGPCVLGGDAPGQRCSPLLPAPRRPGARTPRSWGAGGLRRNPTRHRAGPGLPCNKCGGETLPPPAYSDQFYWLRPLSHGSCCLRRRCPHVQDLCSPGRL